MSAISLRSGNTYEGPSLSEPENKADEEFEEVMVEEGDGEETELKLKSMNSMVEERKSNTTQANSEGVQGTTVIPIATEEHETRASGRGHHGDFS